MGEHTKGGKIMPNEATEGHQCWLNEPRICEDCYERACKERDEARAALMDAVNNWRHSDDSHARFHDDKMLERWKSIANAEAVRPAVADVH
ncbi:MAG: hypothetical protein KA760_13815 [Steroidobacteraceae bacterium]|nr:hypothetical protein [Steroidobacteraceae bacterium]